MNKENKSTIFEYGTKVLVSNRYMERSPIMTVIGTMNEDTYIKCIWFDRNECYHQQAFPIEWLKRHFVYRSI